jgi:hypothetical protein
VLVATPCVGQAGVAGGVMFIGAGVDAADVVVDVGSTPELVVSGTVEDVGTVLTVANDVAGVVDGVVSAT